MRNPFSLSRLSSIFGGRGNGSKRFLSGISPAPYDPTTAYGAAVASPVIANPETSDPTASMDWMAQNSQPPAPLAVQPRVSRYLDLLKSMDQPGPSLTAYQDALKSQPTYESTKPGWKRRLGAGVVGGLTTYGTGNPMAGISQVNDILETPYKRAITDYNSKIRGLGESARLEEDQRQNRQSMVKAAMGMNLDYDKFMQQQENWKAEQKVREGNLNVNQQRAQVYIDNIKMPNYDLTPQEDGSIIAVNKKNPAETRIISAKTVAAAQLGVAKINAATGQKNAATSAESVKNTKEYRDKLIDVRKEAVAAAISKSENKTPAEGQKAIDLALQMMQGDPQWREFIKETAPGSGIYSMDTQDKSTMPTARDAFLKRLQELSQQILRSGSPFGGQDLTNQGLNDGSILIGPPR